MKKLLLILMYSMLLLNDPAKAKEYAIGEAYTSMALQTGVEVSVAPAEKKGRFNQKTGVNYILTFKNKLKQEQTGEIFYSITNERGHEILQKTFDISIPENHKFSEKLLIPHQIEGTFNIAFEIRLTNINTRYTHRFVYANGKLPKADPTMKGQAKIKKVKLDQDLKKKKNAEEEIKLVLKPDRPDGTFPSKSNIRYTGNIKSTYKEAQEGTIGYTVKEQITGNLIYSKIYDIRLKKEVRDR